MPDATHSPLRLADPLVDRDVDEEPLAESDVPGAWHALLLERNALRAQLAATTADLFDALACVEEWRTLAEQRLVLLEQADAEAEPYRLRLLGAVLGPESFG